MDKRVLIILVYFGIAISGFAVRAPAEGREPASCLLFPYFNTKPGNISIITITNSSPATILIRLVWIDDTECSPEDQWRELTGEDTFTFLDIALNPEQEQGFLYVYVVPFYGSKAEMKADVLIGQECIFSSWGAGPVVSFSINAVPFRVGANNVNGDGKLELDGHEFELAPKTIFFPRFFGQDGFFISRAILINLTGGKFFTANADVLIYNDNEQVFSSTVEFPCFWYGPLTDISNATKESFLLTTDHDENELFDGSAPPNKKTGWLDITGQFSYYFTNQIDHASLYGLIIEKVGPGFAADLPWELKDSTYDKGMLWSTSVNGN